MPQTVTCPQCQKNYKLRDDYAGGKLRCKACQTVFTVPKPDLFAHGILPDLPPDPPPSDTPPLYSPQPLPPRVVTVAPPRPTAPAQPLYLWQRVKAFAFAGVLLVIGVVLVGVSYKFYSEAATLAQSGTPGVANVTHYRLEETRGRYGTKNYTDKYTLAYGEKLQYNKEVTLAFKVIFAGTSQTGNALTYDGHEIREPQVHVLYLTQDPQVVLAGQKGDPVSTLLSKNDKWATILVCGIIGAVMLLVSLAVGFKSIFYRVD